MNRQIRRTDGEHLSVSFLSTDAGMGPTLHGDELTPHGLVPWPVGSGRDKGAMIPYVKVPTYTTVHLCDTVPSAFLGASGPFIQFHHVA